MAELATGPTADDMPPAQSGSRIGPKIGPQNTAVLTLTYGDRIAFLDQVLAAVAAAGVARAFVLANGLSEAVAQNLAEVAGARPDLDVQIVTAPENLGSAAGYARLLDRMLQDPEIQAAWFLDDDNVPQPEALSHLLDVVAAGPATAACALRTDHTYMADAIRRGYALEPMRGEAFGVDILKRPRRLLTRLRHRLARSGSGGGLTPATHVPYGGLLVPRDMVVRAGLPRTDFVLYMDDFEYSKRIAETGQILLVPEALVDDVDVSWNATGAGQEAKKAPRSQTGKLVQMTPDFRMYYAVRNAIYLDFRRLTLLSAPLFAINLTLLLGGTGAKALLAGRPGNAKALFDAVTDGLRGRLGRAAGYPLP
ncbi:glycosyltransferase [Dinoroseobacter sp. S76]|uniref:glycosyltransferase n=1 Tax=Dinoroseobacter sp. S76 TaxID=3415124 RepID=UPI003C7CE960